MAVGGALVRTRYAASDDHGKGADDGQVVGRAPVERARLHGEPAGDRGHEPGAGGRGDAPPAVAVHAEIAQHAEIGHEDHTAGTGDAGDRCQRGATRANHADESDDDRERQHDVDRDDPERQRREAADERRRLGQQHVVRQSGLDGIEPSLQRRHVVGGDGHAA